MKLIEAAKIIKEACKQYKSCDKCPLRTYDDSCYIQDVTPSDWEFQYDDIPPRMFV